jgi:hypothetical protein
LALTTTLIPGSVGKSSASSMLATILLNNRLRSDGVCMPRCEKQTLGVGLNNYVNESHESKCDSKLDDAHMSSKPDGKSDVPNKRYSVMVKKSKKKASENRLTLLKES